MPDRINTHVFEAGSCLHCGISSANEESSKKSCVWRDAPPRAVPQSVFVDLTQIGDRMTEIRRAEGRAGENGDACF